LLLSGSEVLGFTTMEWADLHPPPAAAQHTFVRSYQ
jgi:hypothetical protein